jgi:hypothetical protein
MLALAGGFEDTSARRYANADDIATFLNAASPEMASG